VIVIARGARIPTHPAAKLADSVQAPEATVVTVGRFRATLDLKVSRISGEASVPP
jgi:hypothetical protein